MPPPFYRCSSVHHLHDGSTSVAPLIIHAPYRTGLPAHPLDPSLLGSARSTCVRSQATRTRIRSTLPVAPAAVGCRRDGVWWTGSAGSAGSAGSPDSAGSAPSSSSRTGRSPWAATPRPQSTAREEAVPRAVEGGTEAARHGQRPSPPPSVLRPHRACPASTRLCLRRSPPELKRSGFGFGAASSGKAGREQQHDQVRVPRVRLGAAGAAAAHRQHCGTRLPHVERTAARACETPRVLVPPCRLSASRPTRSRRRAPLPPVARAALRRALPLAGPRGRGRARAAHGRDRSQTRESRGTTDAPLVLRRCLLPAAQSFVAHLDRGERRRRRLHPPHRLGARPRWARARPGTAHRRLPGRGRREAGRAGHGRRNVRSGPVASHTARLPVNREEAGTPWGSTRRRPDRAKGATSRPRRAPVGPRLYLGSAAASSTASAASSASRRRRLVP
jgi:hypothetical protein